MDNEKFVELAKKAVVEYHNENNSEKIIADDVYVVWLCKTLQNNKTLLSTNVDDGMYYEVTLNGDKEEMYLDAYKKEKNICIDLKENEKVDKTELKKFIDKVNNLDQTKYSDSSWLPFAETLAKANDLYNDENATQEEVDKMHNNLVIAYLNLRLIPNKDLLGGK